MQAKVLNERVDKERENMIQFKDTMKMQFEQRQIQVRETIGKLKERFQETVKDNEEIHKRKMEKLEKAKDKGKDRGK